VISLPFLVWASVALGAPNWAELDPEVNAGDASAVIVRVLNADSTQAPMIRLEVDGVEHEVGCADDGSFPDASADDGVFHCARKVAMGLVERDEWVAKFSMRGVNGEPEQLGSLVYAKGGGYRFATLTIGSSGSASGAEFDLPSTEPRAKGTPPPAPADGNEGDAVPSVAEPPPSPAAAPPAEPEMFTSHTSGPPWAWMLVALAAGWMAGRQSRSKPRQTIESVRPMPIAPLGGNGPVPDGAITVRSGDVDSTVREVCRSLTVLRRIVFVGEPPEKLDHPGHDQMVCTDPDSSAIVGAVDALFADGGVPPVLFIVDGESVIDTSGASTDPLADAVEAAAERTWVVVFIDDAGSSVPGTDLWSHDPQAGWSRN
jgi:hypothetical protein